MNTSINNATPRLHPLVVAAAASVTVVSLLGAAAITGIFPLHSNAAPAAASAATTQVVATAVPAASMEPATFAAPARVTATRFETSDGRVFEEVPARASPRIVEQAAPVAAAEGKPAVHHVSHHKVVHHYAQNTAYLPASNTADQPAYVNEQPNYPQHPVRNYVSDINPVGTGVGAVVGGLLGNQVGGGNGKKLATVAGVLLGGYAGNEVAHDRNPIPFSNR